ncbi:MAG: DEAD/DEAH box helicase [Chlamydiales bacterium]|nr:DEAD/DEAH box helicase [Chlamydiales bacterium]
MLNFRKLRQDFSSNILKEGKELFDNEAVIGAKILHLDAGSIRLSSRVRGAFENVYESEVEIDRNESIAIDSNCDCTYTYDCQHISALLYYLERNLDEILVAYSEETDLDSHHGIDDEEKQELREAFEKAASKEDARKDQQYQKEVLREYVSAAKHLGASPFFLPQEVLDEDHAELAVIFNGQVFEKNNQSEIQLAIRLPSRSKPLYIPNIRAFLDAVRYREPISISGKRYFFTLFSFDQADREVMSLLLHHATFSKTFEERQMRVAYLNHQALGSLLARVYDLALSGGGQVDKEAPMPCLFSGNLEEPLCFSTSPAEIKCTLEYLEAPGPMLLLKPSFQVDEETIDPIEALLFESTKPGLIYRNTYYRFQPHIKRVHLQAISLFHEITIPEALFGTFIENALPLLRQYAEVTNPSLIDRFVTLPYVEKLKARCVIHYLNGELEAELFFTYGDLEIPAALSKLEYSQIVPFVAQEGILARNLVEERKIIEEIFEDFLFDEKEGVFRVKSEKKIVEFMTEIIPRTSEQIIYECPENLSEQFIYDESTFELHFRESKRIDTYEVELKVDGHLKGTKLDLLWDCIASKKRFLEMHAPGQKKAGRKNSKMPRILVLDLDKIAPLVQIFDEVGLEVIDTHVQERPLWSLTSINALQFQSLPVKYSMSKRLQQIQKQILGEAAFTAQKVPASIQADLRNYQLEGVHWLERLRRMHLNGILADDMGLGKTLQAIIAITQSKQENPDSKSLIVCPTSLVYNWQEEFHKFNPQLKALVVDATPSQRRKLIKSINSYDVVITSYNLLQKDIEFYKEIDFDYVVLDEAQHIKNRGTRNAKSVKMIQAAHRLILTGTPIENSLEELWSLFDFLMPGLLSNFDRFVEKYIRNCGHTENKSSNIETLRKKVSPFILRRMKEDVLEDLPPVSEILYHCHLTEMQQELYTSYAKSAKEELSRLVKKEGFDKIQIHVLATLTRLKQICCHPAIFAKEKPELGDSAKYDMLMELLPSLIEGKHKTVIFSQYTKMLQILREDMKHRGIPFAYLDGSSKNRLEIVKQFNEDQSIPVFLVSLKAGGSGLNLVGADTVIHYDMWWNPAVENQATDRVHRLGQKKSVSSYKLVTLNTIEEKILNLQNRKKGLVKKVMSSDDEAISKLTWEEVLELLQT